MVGFVSNVAEALRLVRLRNHVSLSRVVPDFIRFHLHVLFSY